MSLMEDLQPEELEELVQELEGESGAEEPLSPEVEKLLRDLEPERPMELKIEAVRQLGELVRSYPQIVKALAEASMWDANPQFRRLAAACLLAPAHQAVVEQHPGLLPQYVKNLLREYGMIVEPEEKQRLDLAETIERARQQRPVSDPPRAQRPRRRKEAATPSRRRKPVSNLHIGLMLSAGVILLWIGIAGVQADMPAGMPRTWQAREFMLYVGLLSLLCLLPAVVLSGWALWNWLAPWGARNVFRRSMEETSAKVCRAWREEQTNAYGGHTGYKYFVTISLQAADVRGDSRDILLKLRVKRPIWESLEAEMIVTVRYAAENPRIALIQGEW